MKFVFSILIIFLLNACSTGRYAQRHDSAPIRPPTSLELQDAVVTDEPVSRGNKPYVVWGQRYVPLTERKPFQQTGIASWYGKKFHGHLTSNGEVYDMYGMSAAHKTLPLPTYVKVTNVANNKSVVVRVNDRGPFHEDRIIDLSFSAAYKIGVYDHGTAKVKVEVLLPELQQKKANEYFVKVRGLKSQADAQESAKGLSFMIDKPAALSKDGEQYALVFGSFNQLSYAETVVEKIKQFGFSDISIETSKP
ncbi:MAG: septal ring lytic transglycosylase RlpA family protein [Gammaproteobacteria bacterium]|nr:septal ring lytic transglycosylase RlpA family protein [Gammaproteobacteria bacterium]